MIARPSSSWKDSMSRLGVETDGRIVERSEQIWADIDVEAGFASGQDGIATICPRELLCISL
eukprot:4592005-Pyramimonas_sp.AAC.1